MPVEAIQQYAAQGGAQGRGNDNAKAKQSHGLAALADRKNLIQQNHGQGLHQTRAGTLQQARHDHHIDVGAETAHNGANGKDHHGAKIGGAHAERADEPIIQQHGHGHRRDVAGGQPMYRILANAKGSHDHRNSNVDHGGVQQHRHYAQDCRECHEGPVFGSVAFEQYLDSGGRHGLTGP